MDISAEKEDKIKKFRQVHDLDLIHAIKSLLDFGIHKQINDDAALNASIDRALDQSKKGLSRPHEEVMAEIRKRYKGKQFAGKPRP